MGLRQAFRLMREVWMKPEMDTRRYVNTEAYKTRTIEAGEGPPKLAKVAAQARKRASPGPNPVGRASPESYRTPFLEPESSSEPAFPPKEQIICGRSPIYPDDGRECLC